VAGNIFVAGFGDGAVRVYDRRLPPRESMVKVWKDHKAWIVKVHMQRGGMRELVSGSATGEVKLWDIRMDSPVRKFLAHTKGMRNMSVHEHAPVIATYGLPQISRVNALLISLQRFYIPRCEAVEHECARIHRAVDHGKTAHQFPPAEPLQPGYRLGVPSASDDAGVLGSW
jgi:hypothetical protein